MSQDERINKLEDQVQRLIKITDQYAANETRVLANVQGLIESMQKQALISERMLDQWALQDLASKAARTGDATDLEEYLKARRKGF